MRLKLASKFTLTVLVILVATMAANTLYFLRASAQLQEQQLVERGRALGRLISLVSPEAILGFDYLLLNDYTREVAQQRDVVYGVVVTPQGIPISSSLGAARPGEARPALERLRHDPEVIHLEFPIAHEGVQLGRFLVGLSRHSVQAELRHQLVIQALIVTAIVLFLSAAIYAVFRFNVLSPIRRLIAASGEVARGEYPVVEVKSSDEFGVLARAFNAMAGEVKQKQEKLHLQANYDALTGLPNRMMAFDRISQDIKRAARAGERLAIYFIDLDNFKHVNDSLGHAAGDALLIAIGKRLQGALRDSDTVARLGGDEFLVVAPAITDELQVKTIAERLLQAVAEPLDLAGRRMVAQCSIGIAIYPDTADTVETLMVNADEAMYQAKTIDHGSAIFFTEAMNVRMRERMRMQRDLEVAIEHGQLSLHFQPILVTASHAHHGAEVLLRWHHPERGMVSPAEFVPLAEASGEIVRMGDWVLEEACRAWSTWNNAGIDPGVLAVNVSRVQFRRRLSKRLAELLHTYRMPAQALELEITESVLLDDHREVADELASLRALGVKLSLDDFGTGYSSLSYLKRFRFDMLKIDRSFVAGLPENPDDVSLVKAILAMARGLDLKVVAEGVESAAQLDFIRARRCEYAQGWLFSKALDAALYTAYLQGAGAGVGRLPQEARA
ncbi:MAG TPA: EAL domain-containing protein [Burkholderiales bacterium]|nr:EAL domain-containing protein [Burkholderiales bacterium]